MEIKKSLIAARAAALTLRTAATERKNAVLLRAASLLTERMDAIIEANVEDLNALKPDTSATFRDRLTLNADRIAHMAESLNQVAALADPVDEVVENRTLANGLLVRRMRSPLGVILMIFEARPNVAVEAFSLAFKSGNVMLLRGGKESMRTTEVLYEILDEALKSEKFPSECLIGIVDPDRKITESLLGQQNYIDVVVPRGGDKLIDFVVKNTRIPIIKNDRGLCHVYVHSDADVDMALEIVANAKTQRPGVCNSMETVLVNEKQAAQFIPRLYEKTDKAPLEWFGCPVTLGLLEGKPRVNAADEKAWDTEYLDLKVNCRVVRSLEEAIAHIEEHGSRHSESIVTKSVEAAREFQSRVDAAAVYWNASTRFTDGFELGLGGELGISTQKLHVRGPVGLRELTCLRWVIDGTGQTRA